MTLLYFDPRFLDHQTGSHPERAQRLSVVAEHLDAIGLDQRCERPDWEPVAQERVARVHSLDYVEALRQVAAEGGGRIEADTVVSPQSYEVARLATGSVCDAVERVVRGEDARALCLVRPPGHHALKSGAMGFCLLNSIAVAARVATEELALDRVLIVDWDVHHGNGTQDAFWRDPQVGFLSIHRWPFYPGTGAADETGSGPGLGTIRNLPVEYGTPRASYFSRFAHELEEFAARFKPQLVLVSAGFDGHREDPIGSLDLETEDFRELTRVVLDVAAVHCAGKIVSALEGGYHPRALAESVEAHLSELLDHGDG